MTVHNEADKLEKNLTQFLTQQCDRPYQVIVVNDTSTDETPDVLKRMQSNYPHLYVTFIPMSPLNPYRQRLALNIGAKAAQGDWIILADISRPPQTTSFLQNLIQVAETGEWECITIHTKKKDNTVCYLLWAELDKAIPLLRKAERKSGNGHRGCWLKRQRGLYDAVAVPHKVINDTLKYIGQDIRGLHLLWLRLRVQWQWLFASSSCSMANRQG